MHLAIRDNPDAEAELDRLLAAVRQQILAAAPAEVAVSLAPPRRYGARTLPGQLQLWWSDEPQVQEKPCPSTSLLGGTARVPQVPPAGG